MEIPEIPGVSIDVLALLRSLEPATLVAIVQSVIDDDAGGRASSSGSGFRLRARGLTLDVPELLRGAERARLATALRSATQRWPAGAAKRQIVQLIEELRADGGALSRSEASYGSLKLPVIHAVAVHERPVRVLGNSLRASASGRVGGTHRSLAYSSSLPQIPESPTGGFGEEAAGNEHALRLGDFAGQLTRAMMQDKKHSELKFLLDAKADVDTRDTEGRTLGHLWSWNLPKSRAGMSEARKKLEVLVRFNADLNARLPDTGDTPLHVLARVFNSLIARAEGCNSSTTPAIIHSGSDAEKMTRGVHFRIRLLLDSRADPEAINSAGQKPIDLVAERFQPTVPDLCSSVVGDDQTALRNTIKNWRIRLNDANGLPQLD